MFNILHGRHDVRQLCKFPSLCIQREEAAASLLAPRALARAVRAKRVLVNYQRQAHKHTHTDRGTTTLCMCVCFLHLGQLACVFSSQLRFVSLPRSLERAVVELPFPLHVCHQYWRHCCCQLRERERERGQSKLNYCATCDLRPLP